MGVRPTASGYLAGPRRSGIESGPSRSSCNAGPSGGPVGAGPSRGGAAHVSGITNISRDLQAPVRGGSRIPHVPVT